MDSEEDYWFAETKYDEEREYQLNKFERYNGLKAADKALQELELEDDFHLEARRRSRASIDAGQNNEKKYQEALNKCNEILDNHRNESGYHANTAVLLHELKRYDDAIAAADRALQLDSSYQYAKDIKANVLNDLAAMAFDAGNYNEAYKKYSQASILNPNAKYFHANAASSLNNLHRYNEAVVAADKALKLDRNYLVAKFRKAHALNEIGKRDFNDGRYEEALDNFTQASSLNPNEKCYHANIASALNYLNKFDEAIASANVALQLDDTYQLAKEKKAYALNKHGDNLFERKSNQEALQKYIGVLELDPNNFHAKNKVLVIKHMMSEKNLN